MSDAIEMVVDRLVETSQTRPGPSVGLIVNADYSWDELAILKRALENRMFVGVTFEHLPRRQDGGYRIQVRASTLMRPKYATHSSEVLQIVGKINRALSDVLMSHPITFKTKNFASVCVDMLQSQAYEVAQALMSQPYGWKNVVCAPANPGLKVAPHEAQTYTVTLSRGRLSL